MVDKNIKLYKIYFPINMAVLAVHMILMYLQDMDVLWLMTMAVAYGGIFAIGVDKKKKGEDIKSVQALQFSFTFISLILTTFIIALYGKYIPLIVGTILLWGLELVTIKTGKISQEKGQ